MRYEVLEKKWGPDGSFRPVVEVSSDDGSWKSGPVEGRVLPAPDSYDELKIHKWLAEYAQAHEGVAQAAAIVASTTKPKVKRGLIDASKPNKATKVGEGKTGALPDDHDDAANPVLVEALAEKI